MSFAQRFSTWACTTQPRLVSAVSILGFVAFCACAQMLIHVQLFVTPWTVAHQAPLSMKFSRQEYWRGLPFPSPGDLPNPGTAPTSLASLALAGRFFTPSALWEAHFYFLYVSSICPITLLLFVSLFDILPILFQCVSGKGNIFFSSFRLVESIQNIFLCFELVLSMEIVSYLTIYLCHIILCIFNNL